MMTEQPDTAAIRARSHYGIELAAYAPDSTIMRDIAALCDALDAARAELRTVNGCLAAQDENEARQRARAEYAEARIAAALECLGLVVVPNGHEPVCVLAECVHRALTEGTGQ